MVPNYQSDEVVVVYFTNLQKLQKPSKSSREIPEASLLFRRTTVPLLLTL